MEQLVKLKRFTLTSVLADFEPQCLFNSPIGWRERYLTLVFIRLYLSSTFRGYPSNIEATSIGSTGVDEPFLFLLRYDQNATAVLSCTILADTLPMPDLWNKGKNKSIPVFTNQKR
jgi:hypothetical protein